MKLPQLFLAFALVSALFVPGAIAAERLPNFVIVFIDDMGYADIGPFGAEGYETPNLDRMAKEGRVFTDFYVTQAVCSASRAGLMTGCYNVRVGILGALGPKATHGINAIPFFTFYSMFGFQRVGDLIWAAADARTRGFLMGGTAGRTTLAGEGLQHQDGHSHLLAATVPCVRAYDPAFGYELALIVHNTLMIPQIEANRNAL